MNNQRYYVNRIEANTSKLRNTIENTLAYYEGVFSEMDESTRLELKVVLSELLINAIKHGGKTDRGSFVKIVAGMVTDDCALLIVEDDGEGYDTTLFGQYRGMAPVGDQIEDINETGRGIYIVKNLCEDFMVNEKGNKVVVNKRLFKAKPA